MEISKEMQEVLKMLVEDNLWPAEISKRRQTSIQATNKTIRKLKKKGLISGSSFRGFQMGGVAITNTVNKGGCQRQPIYENLLRYHGIKFRVRILKDSPKYQALRQQGNRLRLDKNTLSLYRNTLVLDSDKDFIGKTAEQSRSAATAYFMRFWVRLQDHLGIMILKDRCANIKQTAGHISHTNNPLARQCLKDNEKIRIRTTEDGKTWATIDNSFNLKEFETQHPDTHFQDMQGVVEPFFNDLRDNFEKQGQQIPKMSEIMNYLKESAAIQKETAAGMLCIAKLLMPPKEDNFNENKDKSRPDYIG
jgi:hypothetical protein